MARDRSSDSLSAYRDKRDFAKTAEPAPSAETLPWGHGDGFMVQKHDATRLHYDLRLELDGTLKSWAVPNGPSLDPADKRLAIRTEDHPLSYATFEGTIPKGEYGGGTVMLWDRGRWTPEGDAKAALRKGVVTRACYPVLCGAALRINPNARVACETFVTTRLAVVGGEMRIGAELDIDTPVEQYLPEFAEREVIHDFNLTNAMFTTRRAHSPVTLRHLLTHSAGFPEDNPWGDRQLAIPDATMTRWLETGIPFSTSPGTAYEYSNYGFALLGIESGEVDHEGAEDSSAEC